MNVVPRQPSSPPVGPSAQLCWSPAAGSTGLSKMYFLAVFRGSAQGGASGCYCCWGDPGRSPHGLRSLLPGGYAGQGLRYTPLGATSLQIQGRYPLTLGLWPTGPICPSPGVTSFSKASWSIFATLPQVTQRFFVEANPEPTALWSPSLPCQVHQRLLPTFAPPPGPV